MKGRLAMANTQAEIASLRREVEELQTAQPNRRRYPEPLKVRVMELIRNGIRPVDLSHKIGINSSVIH